MGSASPFVERGAWSVERGAWSVERGAWSGERGGGSVERGAWSVERGAWSVERGACKSEPPGVSLGVRWSTRHASRATLHDLHDQWSHGQRKTAIRFEWSSVHTNEPMGCCCCQYGSTDRPFIDSRHHWSYSAGGFRCLRSLRS